MLEFAIGIVALAWTIYQQYQISQICKSCSIRQAYIELLKERENKKEFMKSPSP